MRLEKLVGNITKLESAWKRQKSLEFWRFVFNFAVFSTLFSNYMYTELPIMIKLGLGNLSLMLEFLPELPWLAVVRQWVSILHIGSPKKIQFFQENIWFKLTFQRQNRLWPFNAETVPWFLHRAHFGVLGDLISKPKPYDLPSVDFLDFKMKQFLRYLVTLIINSVAGWNFPHENPNRN